jgi:hypothetical protein
MFHMTNNDALADIIRYANVLGLRVVDGPKFSFLPRGVRVICRSVISRPIAYIWPDGRVSAGASVSGSFSEEYVPGHPTFVIDPTRVTAYLDAIAAKRDAYGPVGYVIMADRRAIVREVNA